MWREARQREEAHVDGEVQEKGELQVQANGEVQTMLQGDMMSGAINCGGDDSDCEQSTRGSE